MHGTLLFIGALIGSAPAAEAASSAPRHYPPCSRTVTDSCIQLTDSPERVGEPVYAGVGGPFEPVDDAVEEHASAAPAETGLEPVNEQDPESD